MSTVSLPAGTRQAPGAPAVPARATDRFLISYL